MHSSYCNVHTLSVHSALNVSYPMLHFSLEALKAALSTHEDIDVIRGIFKEGDVPTAVRVDLWKVLL